MTLLGFGSQHLGKNGVNPFAIRLDVALARVSILCMLHIQITR
jgi:hypothetical protein